MNIPEYLCKTAQFIPPLYVAGIIVFIIFMAFAYSFYFFILKRYSNIFIKVISGIGVLMVFLFITAVIAVITFYIYGYDDNPPSKDYHPLNASIKQRCYDEHPPTFCPKDEKMLTAITPEEVKEKLKSAHITYRYYPDSNDYTLIIRNNNYLQNNKRAVLFDSRLTKLKDYGRHGLDFFDVDIAYTCGSGFRITNPPPLPGLWDRVN